jgi:hypothetical protein
VPAGRRGTSRTRCLRRRGRTRSRPEALTGLGGRRLLPPRGPGRARSVGIVTNNYESHGTPLAEYQLTRADHRCQEERERRAEYIRRVVDSAPPLSAETASRIRELLGPFQPPSPSDYMRWRVRLYCGHIQEVACLLSKTRPHSEARCRECGKDPSVIVAFEPIGPFEDLPSASPARRRNIRPQRTAASRRTKAELEERTPR